MNRVLTRFLKVLLFWTVLTHVQPMTEGIINRKRINSTTTLRPPQFIPRRETSKRKSYLQSNRPLWVLEDKVNRPGDLSVPTQELKGQRRFITPVTPSSILPNHYTNLNPPSLPTTVPSRRSKARRRKHSTKNHRKFPVFDDDYEMESEPILIYRGPKAKMIFNTMLSRKKYPMQEPVPGQILYPPYSPKFKPTPVVERVQSESYPGSVFHNVTWIPFYTHEAVVDPRIGYSAPFEVSDPEPQPSTTNEECHNCYHSYYSQNDVQAKYWSLPYITPSPETTTPMDVRKQIEGTYPNHRTEESTTPLPFSSADEGSFRIVYDNSEVPNPSSSLKKRYRSVLSAKYGGFKTVYPIYTLNKLLRYKPYKNRGKKDGDVEKPSAPEETWLIWNSRNREAHKSNYMNSVDLPKNHKMSRMIDHKLLIK